MKKFGKPWAEVHRFLDQFFPAFGPYHRIVLHHRRGIDLLIPQIPGSIVRHVAEQHIIDDLGFVPEDWFNPEFDDDRINADTWPSQGAKNLETVLKELYG